MSHLVLIPILWFSALGHETESSHEFRFASQPVAEEFRVGREIASKTLKGQPWARTAQRLPLQRVWQGDQIVLGTWNDGLTQRVADTALPLSPALFSRWLGYLSQSNGLEEEEIQDRWQVARAFLDSRMAFIVQLSAFPTKMIFEAPLSPPKTEDITEVRFMISSGEREISADSHLLFQFRGSSRSELENLPWWRATELDRLLGSDWDQPLPSDSGWGDYHRAIYLVSIPVSEVAGREIIFRVLSPNKERRATLSLFKKA
ncbi:MAG: hypothetical protein MUC92_02635 [Fimbriimonadaceae bacterium]|nr:hypothetical protein [Fimbriimonadaceae bacterium]